MTKFQEAKKSKPDKLYCMLCGSELIIGGNNMLSDFDDLIFPKDDALVTNATCSNCAANYLITDSTESQREEISSFLGTAEIYKKNE